MDLEIILQVNLLKMPFLKIKIVLNFAIMDFMRNNSAELHLLTIEAEISLAGFTEYCHLPAINRISLRKLINYSFLILVRILESAQILHKGDGSQCRFQILNKILILFKE